jgi:hypothetical protein
MEQEQRAQDARLAAIRQDLRPQEMSRRLNFVNFAVVKEGRRDQRRKCSDERKRMALPFRRVFAVEDFSQCLL